MSTWRVFVLTRKMLPSVDALLIFDNRKWTSKIESLRDQRSKFIGPEFFPCPIHLLLQFREIAVISAGNSWSVKKSIAP